MLRKSKTNMKAKKRPWAVWGKKTSGIAGRRGRQNFIWAVRSKHLLKKLGL